MIPCRHIPLRQTYQRPFAASCQKNSCRRRNPDELLYSCRKSMPAQSKRIIARSNVKRLGCLIGTPRQNVAVGVVHVRGEIPTLFQPSVGTKGSYCVMWGEPRADGYGALLQAQTPRGTVRLRFILGCLATAVLIPNAQRENPAVGKSTPYGYPVCGRIVPLETCLTINTAAPPVIDIFGL